ncbi:MULTISPECIES: GatB/YqeY domain-containing protein [unclassified Sporolactobacillus]|uniref:GatB/YqeY domain-containing protein n=1 Tax=unclassified Sporolactobacillus TaxID=2628533 RepID=UPI0023688125|nr:GatB/YqeY domain-containing protein [Sporolactobacillus sp. CQH2019]MDD9147593.1 GatB/YqeY domain-containing protein [Sporolactobacillus sp. CQH2019]
MSLVDRLTTDMKQAMKAKDKARLSVIRMIKTSLQNESIKNGKPLSEDEALTVLTRELKQRKDSLREFENAGRQDLVDEVSNEIAIVQSYMPEQLSDDEILFIIEKAISEVGAQSSADIGKVMKAVMPKVKGRADGSQINRLVRKKLS